MKMAHFRFILLDWFSLLITNHAVLRDASLIKYHFFVVGLGEPLKLSITLKFGAAWTLDSLNFLRHSLITHMPNSGKRTNDDEGLSLTKIY